MTLLKILSKAVIPEVRNRESIFFQEAEATWVPAFAGMTTFFDIVK